MVISQSIHIIIVAAGRGTRFGAPLPKQFCPLAGRPVLMHTIDATRRAVPDASIAIVLNDNDRDLWRDLCDKNGFTSPEIVSGGATRWNSVKNAVDKIADDFSGVVLIHDGARPIVNANVVNKLISTAREHGAAIPATPVTDSIRRVNPDGTSEAVDRSSFRAVQTPQAFDFDVLKKAYDQPYTPLFTDDASVVEHSGVAVHLVDGDPMNIKITNSQDIEIAQLYLDITRRD